MVAAGGSLANYFPGYHAAMRDRRAARPRPSLGGLPPAAGRAWATYLRSHARVVQQLSHELEAAHGMPLTYYDVLVQLAFAPERRLRMAELAEAVVLSRPGLTGVVNRLESEGLLRRERAADDGRGVCAVLTDHGLDRLHEVHRTHVRSIRERFASRFTEEELETLGELLRRI